MANINVRGLPDETKQALRVRAAQAGLSLEGFARRILTRAAFPDMPVSGPGGAGALSETPAHYDVPDPDKEMSRGEALVASLRGQGTGRLSTDQIMALTRDWPASEPAAGKDGARAGEPDAA